MFTQLRRDKTFVAASVVLLLTVAACLFGPWLSPHDPNLVQLANAFQAPGSEHWLGTDWLGRDMLTRLLVGGRLSMAAAVIGLAVAALLGTPLGLVSGYVGGYVDVFISRFTDALLTFPALVLAIAIVGFTEPGLVNAMIAVGIVYSPRFIRVLRGATLKVKNEDYIEAAQLSGLGVVRIIYRHVFRNVAGPFIVTMTLTAALATLAEAGLSFLGLGAQPPSASWGAILATGYPYIDRIPLAT